MITDLSDPQRRWIVPQTLTMLGLVFVLGSCASSPSCSSEDGPAETAAEPVDDTPDEPAEPTTEERLAALSVGTAAVDDAAAASEDYAEQWWDELIATAMDPSEPLPDVVRSALEDVEFDPHPDSLTRDSHYWVSNEDHHHLFRDALDGHGGIFMGVGTDQNYMMAAWSEAPILLLMDFDEQIRNVHHLYELNFRRAETPSAFIDLWSSGSAEEQMYEALREEYGDGGRYDDLKRAFDIARQTIHWRLRRTARTYDERGIPTFLTDQQKYDFIRNLWKKDRVFPIRGDLTGDTTMVDIATTLDELGLNMGAIYTSNAEQYFDFIPSYRRNIVVQPFDDDSLLLRTRPASAFGLADGGDYHYNVQPGKNFAAWMEHSRIANSWRLLAHHRETTDTEGLSYIHKEPQPADPPPELAEFPGSEE